MLPAAMRRLAAATIALVLALSLALAACGEEETHEVFEGEPLELGELGYNVQLTRFLNPDDVEDAEYLVGQPPPETGKDYLGVFMVVENHDKDEAHPAPPGTRSTTPRTSATSRSSRAVPTRSRSAPTFPARASCRCSTRPRRPGPTRARC